MQARSALERDGAAGGQPTRAHEEVPQEASVAQVALEYSDLIEITRV